MDDKAADQATEKKEVYKEIHRADFLSLWVHYEERGYDDKNRMISTASLLIGFSGALLGMSISALSTPAVAIVVAVLSCLTSLVSAILVEFFEIFAGWNFHDAALIRKENFGDVNFILDEIRPLPKDGQPKNGPPPQGRLRAIGAWLANPPQGCLRDIGERLAKPSVTAAREPLELLKRGTTTGPIFSFFLRISQAVAGISGVVLFIAIGMAICGNNQ
jgi:hypothetical protein